MIAREFYKIKAMEEKSSHSKKKIIKVKKKCDWGACQAINGIKWQMYNLVMLQKSMIKLYNIKSISHYYTRYIKCFQKIADASFKDTWKVKIWLSKEYKELSKWNKKDFSLFHKCFLLDIQDKLRKM